MKGSNNFKNRKVIKLDAAKSTAGRLASQSAKILIGKHKKYYQANEDFGDFVQIININKLNFSGKKLKQKKYYKVSGYLGGIKSEILENLIKKDPGSLFKKIVYNMLPNNKLRKSRLKRLMIK